MAFLETPQGVLAPDILLGEESANLDDRDLVQEVVDFVNWLLADARRVFGEVGDPARGLYLLDQYIAQVENGGHAQYVGNVACSNQQAGTHDLAMALISLTLADCAEPDYLDLFHDFDGLLQVYD